MQQIGGFLLLIDEAQRLNNMGFRELDISHVIYAPWEVDGTPFRALYNKVPEHSPIRIYGYFTLYCLAKQSLSVEGSFFECGVFRGGSASFFANLMEGSGKKLHLFDTFEGMPETNREHDTLHIKGDFDDTSLDEVRATVGHADDVVFHKGIIPSTFPSVVDEKIAFAHIDVDIYQSVIDCVEFIYPRMQRGGVIVFDDYGHHTCPGANEAVNNFFADKPENPVPLIFGQALVFKI